MKPKAKAASRSTGPASGGGFLRRRNVRTFFLPLALITLAAVLLRIVMSVQVVATDPFAFAPPDVKGVPSFSSLLK